MPCQTEKIERIVRQAGEEVSREIRVIYYAAHAFGSSVGDRKVCSFGDAEVFSLSATKALVSVEGGLVATKDSGLVERLRGMRNYGIGQNYEAFWPGLNGKMSELHAIVGIANLKRLDELLDTRRNLEKTYSAAVNETTGFRTIPVPEGTKHTFKDFCVVVPEELADRRDDVMEFLQGEGIETRRYFWPPIHMQRFFESFVDGPLPHTESLGRRVIALPFFTTMSIGQVERVVHGLAKAEEVL